MQVKDYNVYYLQDLVLAVTGYSMRFPCKLLNNQTQLLFCSASSDGKLHDEVYTKLSHHLNNLLGVLMRFRLEKVPLLGDIESMFYQVKVPPKDRNFLRFLWWPNGNYNTHIFCKIDLPVNTNGDTIPNGSYTELTIDSMPRLVIGLLFMLI
jgi:hypothetical protein